MTPRELALALLRQRFGRDVPADAEALVGLVDFQRDAVQRLLRALERYGGALLADSVGLGKTHVGAAIVRHAVRQGGAAAVIVPATLLRQWRRALRGVPRVSFTTHATLSRGSLPVAAAHTTLLVVDEAHGFRNPASRRYAALARIAAGRNLLLITASPVNNSLRDLYWLLRLFADDAAFAGAGVPDLFSCFRAAERSGRTADVQAVLGEIAVRRTRELLGDLALQGDNGGITLRFPRRADPREVAYVADAAAQRALLGCIQSLRLAPWTQFGAPATSLLLRLVLLKRLESGQAALRASLARLLATLRDFDSALTAGRLLTPAEQRLRRAGAAEQLAFDDLLLRPLPKHLDAHALAADAAHDVRALTAALAQLADTRDDPKVAALRTLVADLDERPVIVFSEYRETAEHLWLTLAAQHRVALIHGSAAYLGRSLAARRTVVERFAPIANGVPPPPAREAVHLLIATDVLAEGLNLQDAADVVSYDLPWNPVRLLQRMGRIDRLGSPHEEVRAWYFRPDRQLDETLALMRRIRRKIAAIRGSIGEEAPVLAPGERGGGSRPGARRPTARRTAKRVADDAFALEERLRQAFARAAKSPGALDDTPLGGAESQEPPDPPAAPAPPMLLAVPRPPAEALQAVDAVLCFETGGRQRLICLRAGRWREDHRAAATLLLQLLEPSEAAEVGQAVPATECRHLVAAARRWLLRPLAPPRRPPRIRQLRSRMYRLLQQRAGGPTAAECLRIERLAARLAGPLSLAEQLALRRIPAAGTDNLETLAEWLESALADAARPPERRPENGVYRSAATGPPGPPTPGPERLSGSASRPRFRGGFLLRDG